MRRIIGGKKKSHKKGFFAQVRIIYLYLVIINPPASENQALSRVVCGYPTAISRLLLFSVLFGVWHTLAADSAQSGVLLVGLLVQFAMSKTLKPVRAAGRGGVWGVG